MRSFQIETTCTPSEAFKCHWRYIPSAPWKAKAARLAAIVEALEGEASAEKTVALDVLRQRALQSAKAQPGSSQQTMDVFERSRSVKDYVFARASGRCEHCREAAPFFTPGGRPFLEAHHIRRMTDGGPDDPRFVIALCPNCHRRVHYGAGAETHNEAMLNYVTAVEKKFSSK